MERFRVDSRRVRLLQQGRCGSGPVVYWLNRDQRVADNWALLHAQDLALRDERGLVVVFCLQHEYLGAAGHHFAFMLQGLSEMEAALQQLSIAFVLLEGMPEKVLPEFVSHADAHCLVTDFNPLRIKKRWLTAVQRALTIPVYEVDAHNIIPCWYASEKREYAAYTLRPKINRLLPDFLHDFPEVERHPHGTGLSLPANPWWKFALRGHGDDYHFERIAGEQAASQALESFLANRLTSYNAKRNDPLADSQSRLSPYFHFGQLAPQRAALSVANSHVAEENREAYLEELIVRRELSDNFCYYCDQYDSVDGFPAWAQRTLDEHRNDPRQYLYTEEEFFYGLTHEPLWNCCQKMLREEGRLHGYLRMYWAKKILEWSISPEEALRIGIALNDLLAFDGRDPNGYAGVAWSVGGVHDRAWPERRVFGKIRWMSESGCRRKFAVAKLIEGCALESGESTRSTGDKMPGR